jgi:transcriptional regulator with XRE-family HTH domain
MINFGERLRAAMLAAGVGTPSKLAARITRLTGKKVARQTVEKWLRMRAPTLHAAHLIAVSAVLDVRLRWFIDESSTGMSRSLLLEMVAVMDSLTPEQQQDWLEIGRSMLGEQFTPPPL